MLAGGCREKGPPTLGIQTTFNKDETGDTVVLMARTEPRVHLRAVNMQYGGGSEPVEADSDAQGLATMRLRLSNHPPQQTIVVTGRSLVSADRPSAEVTLPVRRPPALVHAGENALECLAVSCRVEVTSDGVFTLSQAPAGATLSVIASAGATPHSGTTRVELPPLTLLDGPPLERVVDHQTVDPLVKLVTVRVRLADGASIDGSLRVPRSVLERHLRTLLTSVRQGGLLPTQNRGSSIALLYYDSMELDRPTPSIASIATVVLATTQRRALPCRGTYRSASGTTSSFVRDLIDIRATAYARATGRRLGERLFEAEVPPCPRAMHLGQRANGFVPPREIYAWAQSLVAASP